MIKVGIAGAESPVAGELLRLCINHPDVDVVTAYAPGYAGHPVSSRHHGFIGEERILFTSSFDATSLDVAFLMHSLYSESDWVKLMADRPQLKLILFPDALTPGMNDAFAPVYGLSEMNRKPLVRGARVAVVPNVLASPLLVALYPLARHLMLAGNIDVEVSAPDDVTEAAVREKAAVEVKRELQRVQTSFNGNISFTVGAPVSSDRSLKMILNLPVSTSEEEVMKIYDSIYDDHNFTYVVHHPVSPAEVAGSDKIVVSVSKPAPDSLRLEIVADPRMRGGAAEAMHLMNLLFGLHEKTGLNLKVCSWSNSKI